MHSSSSQSAVNGIMQQRTIRALFRFASSHSVAVLLPKHAFSLGNSSSSILLTFSYFTKKFETRPSLPVSPCIPFSSISCSWKRIIEEIPKLRFGCTSSDSAFSKLSLCIIEVSSQPIKSSSSSSTHQLPGALQLARCLGGSKNVHLLKFNAPLLRLLVPSLNVKGTERQILIVVVLRSRRILSHRLIYAHFAIFSTIRNASSSSPAGHASSSAAAFLGLVFLYSARCHGFLDRHRHASYLANLGLFTIFKSLQLSNRVDTSPSPVSRSAFELITAALLLLLFLLSKHSIYHLLGPSSCDNLSSLEFSFFFAERSLANINIRPLSASGSDSLESR